MFKIKDLGTRLMITVSSTGKVAYSFDKIGSYFGVSSTTFEASSATASFSESLSNIEGYDPLTTTPEEFLLSLNINDSSPNNETKFPFSVNFLTEFYTVPTAKEEYLLFAFRAKPSSLKDIIVNEAYIGLLSDTNDNLLIRISTGLLFLGYTILEADWTDIVNTDVQYTRPNFSVSLPTLGTMPTGLKVTASPDRITNFSDYVKAKEKLNDRPQDINLPKDGSYIYYVTVQAESIGAKLLASLSAFQVVTN